MKLFCLLFLHAYVCLRVSFGLQFYKKYDIFKTIRLVVLMKILYIEIKSFRVKCPLLFFFYSLN